MKTKLKDEFSNGLTRNSDSVCNTRESPETGILKELFDYVK